MPQGVTGESEHTPLAHRLPGITSTLAHRLASLIILYSWRDLFAVRLTVYSFLCGEKLLLSVLIVKFDERELNLTIQ